MLRLLNGHSLTTKALMQPESMGLNLSERESSATPTVGPGGPGIATGDWLQDLEEPGAGIVWRVKAIDRQYDTDTITYSLEHAIRTLADKILPKEVKASDMGGSGDTCTAKQAAQYILGKQSDWVLGDFEYNNVSNPYRFSGETLLAALETVTGSLEDPVWEYDFTVYPFKLHIRQMSGDVDSELRPGRNITTLKYTIDRTRMYTRFYPVGKNNLRLSGNGYVSRNENTYGRVDKTETDQSKDTEAKLTAWANERLKRHAEPLVTVTISGMDLSESTGESLDKVKISRYKCRVPLPEYGTTILEKVTKLSWRDKIRDKESVTVTLANALADVQSIIKEEKARGGGGSRTAAELNEEKEILIGDVESGLYTRITQTASEIRQEAHDEARSLRSIISQTAESIRLTVESDVGSLRSQIVQTAESIRMEVTNEAASLRSQIVQTAESIRSEVANEAASLRSSITQTAESIRAEVADESASIRSVITQTAASIRSEITDEASSLRSEITQQAGRIDLVVSGSGASAAIRLSAIVNGINQSQLELSADRVVVNSGSSSQKVKVYIDGAISATEGDITNLKTGVTKATLINADSVVADNIAGGTLSGSSLSIGSGSSGGSGTLYYRGSMYYRQGLVLGGAGGSIAEAHFLGDNSVTTNLDHYHKIVATEGTGADAGKIILTLTDPVATSDTANSTTNFNIAATTAYQNGVLAARNAVKVQPFTADARQGANNDHRTFTYITDAPTPDQGTSQVDTWYLVPTDNWSSNKKTVNLRYGSSGGTSYASVEVDASDVYNAVTVAAPYCTDGAVAAGGTRTTIPMKADASNGNKSNAATMYLQSGTYGSNSDRCVNLNLGGVTIGRISTQGVYDAGVTAGENEFSLASVTLQGSSVSLQTIKPTTTIRIDSTAVTLYNAGTDTKTARGDSVTARPKLSSGGTIYYQANSATTYYQAGTDTKTARGDSVTAREVVSSGGTVYYTAGTAVTRYKGDGGSFTVQGSAFAKLKRWGNGTLYQYTTSGYVGQGSHTWYYVDNTNGTQYYEAGTTTKIARGTSESITPISSTSVRLGSSGTYYKGNGGDFTVQGSSVSVTPIKTTSAIRLGDEDTYYKGNGGDFTVQGSSVSVTPIKATSAIRLGDEGTYYKGDGGDFTVQGTAQAAYKKLTTGGTFYYQANAAATYYQAGSTVADTYYTKN